MKRSSVLSLIGLALLGLSGKFTFSLPVRSRSLPPTEPLPVPRLQNFAPLKNAKRASAWSQFRGDRANSGRGLGSVSGLTKNWTFGCRYEVQCSPVLDTDGTVYLGMDGIHAVNAATGVEKWRAIPADLVTATPALGTHGQLFAGSSSGYVYAFQRVTGKLLWSRKLEPWLMSSLAVEEDNTLIACSSKAGIVWALDGDTGTIKWKLALGEILVSSPAIDDDGTIYFGTAEKKVYALEGNTGRRKWVCSVQGVVESSPCLGANGLLYIGSGTKTSGQIQAIQIKTGKIKWQIETGKCVVGAGAVDESGTFYIGCENHIFYAINGETGTVKWTFKAGDGISSSPALGHLGIVYFGSWDGKLYALDTATGAEQWKFETNGDIVDSPAVSPDEAIYFGSYDKTWYALAKRPPLSKAAFDSSASP